MVELEKKIDRQTEGRIDNLHSELVQKIDEVKTLSGESVQSAYKKLLENMIDLEKRVAQRQDTITAEFKKEFSALLSTEISRQEGMTIENYKKVLELLLELEKKLDTRQNDLILELRKDFAKIIAQLDITNIKNQLELTFGKKIGDVEQRLSDQERALSNQFNDLMKNAEIQLQKAVD